MTKLEEKKIKKQVIDELGQMFCDEDLFQKWMGSKEDIRIYEFILNHYKNLHKLDEMKENAKLEPNTKYNMLTVLSLHHIDNNYKKYYECLCDCGNKTIVEYSKIKNGYTKSCGCLRKAIKTGANSGERIRKEQLNGKIKSTNTSGVTGVSYDKKLGYWIASLQYRNKSYRVRCKTFKQAIAERKKLEQKFEIYSDEGIKKECEE